MNKSINFYNDGDNFYRQGHYEKAITCFEEAIKIDPHNYKAWHDKGLSLYKQGNYEEAITCYEEAIKLKPDNDTYWNNKGYSLYKQGNYKEAITCFGEAIKINDQNSFAFHYKGSSLYRQDSYEEAIIYFNKAIKINPNNYKAWYDKGSSLCRLSNYSEAIKCYNKVIKLTPYNDKVWHDKGLALYEQGNYEEAIECYNKAITFKPDNDKARHDRGEALKKLGKGTGETYRPLKLFFESIPHEQEQIALTFDELGKKRGTKLPQSALNNGNWWKNTESPQALAWISAGWVVESIYLNSKIAVFRRKWKNHLKDIRTYVKNILEASPDVRIFPVDTHTLVNWLKRCRKIGWYFEGKVLYEQGGMSFNLLDETEEVEVNEDYEVCMRELNRYKQEMGNIYGKTS